MKISVEQVKRVGGIAIETLLGVFLLAIVLETWTSNNVQASAATSPKPAPAAEALLPQAGTDFCIQDDTTGAFIAFNTVTGNYMVTDCASFSLSGTGRITIKGCTITLQHNATDRRVLASLYSCTNRGTAGAQQFPTGRALSIIDRNTLDNSCACVVKTGP